MVKIYLITNTINGHRYVGQTNRTLKKRLQAHCFSKDDSRYLYRAMRKYGLKNFNIELIGEVPNRDFANEFEKEYITRYNSLSPNGYNLTQGGLGHSARHSEEAKQKISRSLIGNKRSLGYQVSEETRRKKSENGKRLCSKERMAELRAMSWSPEHRGKRIKKMKDTWFIKTVAWG